MPTNVALLVISVLLGAGVATLGLYFGTNLFDRDPLAGMEAEPITAPQVPEAATARIEEVAWLRTESEAPTADASNAESRMATPGDVGAAPRLAHVEPDGADVLAAAIPSATEADNSEVSAQAAAPLAAARSVKRWKPSYIPVADSRVSEIETSAAAIGEAETAGHPVLRQPASLRQPLPRVGISAAEVVNDTRMAAVKSAPPVAWKTSMPLVAHAAVGEVEDAAMASAPEPPTASERDAAMPTMPRDRVMVADARSADNAPPAEAAELAPRPFVEWKTSPALATKSSMATADDDLLAALPAAVDRPEVAPEATTIAIETVDFRDPDRITIAGLTQPHALVRVHLNGEPLDETRSDRLGMWRANGTRELGGGRHLVRAEVFDDDSVRQASAEMRFERVQIVMGEQPPLVDAAREAPLAEEREVAERRAAGPTAVHIERGDNLWHIARAIYGDGHLYTEIYELNRNQIRNPNLIYPGQVFTIPVLESSN